MKIRKLKEEDTRIVTELFPSLAPGVIASYIHRHPGLTTVDYVTHFLREASPTRNNVSLQSNLLLAQARTILRNGTDSSGPKPATPGEGVIEIQKRVNGFPIPGNCKAIADRIIIGVGQLRIQRKRARFQDEDYLTRMAFAYANELKMGYISLDAREWELWFRSQSDTITDQAFACGFIPKLADPVHSIINMIDHEPEMKRVVVANVRFCGLGVAVSPLNSVFFAIFLGNRS
jgi:hypothetical protein